MESLDDNIQQEENYTDEQDPAGQVNYFFINPINIKKHICQIKQRTISGKENSIAGDEIASNSSAGQNVQELLKDRNDNDNKFIYFSIYNLN